LVGVEGGVLVDVTLGCGVIIVPVTAVAGVEGVPGVPPEAITVCAAAVSLANCSIISIGFSTEGNGDTNRPVGIMVGVAAGGCDNENVQLDIKTAPISRIATAKRPRWF
jgi:hypothetical protein